LIMDPFVKQLVTETIKRLARGLGADGTRGKLVVVFSGATVGIDDAMSQVRGLIYDGYQVHTAFSDNAAELFGTWVEDQLLGLPFVYPMTPSDWYSVFTDARAVVVPLLSLNTAAKVSLLIADTLPTNLMLHALASGKPLFAAYNGADPERNHWRPRTGVAPAFRQAALDRLKVLEGFGCRLTDVKHLRIELNQVLTVPVPLSEKSDPCPLRTPERLDNVSSAPHVVTAAHIRWASDHGMGLSLAPGAIVTPLARDLAMTAGVKLTSKQA
jgi:hypothetical protein